MQDEAPRLSHHRTKSEYSQAFRKSFRDPRGVVGWALVGVVVTMSLLAPVITPYDPAVVNADLRWARPSADHLLGTDSNGRDVFSRVLTGGRLDLAISALVVTLIIAAGTIIGLFSGYIGGLVDEIIMRIVDVMLSVPALILAIAAIAVFGPGLFQLVAVVTLIWIPGVARFVRGQALEQRNRTYVEAAKAVGHRRWYILTKEILPNITPYIIVVATIDLGYVILLEASLSFLGLGVQPPDVAWGTMLYEARGFLGVQPWAAMGPGIAIFVTILGINLLGDVFRDIFDPTLAR